MADKPTFTVTAYTDKDLAEKVSEGSLPPETDVVRHDLLDSKGKVVATGMTAAQAREAIAARHGADVSGLVKKGALGHDAEALKTVATLAK